MPERFYSLLLWLYPARFRREYGEEAIRLLRERLRDERGFRARLRLWLELLADVGASVPREHRRADAGVAAAPVQMAGVPAFRVLESEPLRPERFAFGTVFAVVAMGLFAFLLNHGGNPQMHGQANWISGNALREGSGSAAEEAAQRAQATNFKEPAPQPVPVITEAERRRVIAGVIADLRSHYGDVGTTERIAEMLTMHEEAGDYRSIQHGIDFADLLTRQMWTASQDQNLGLIYSLGALRSGPDEPGHAEPVNIYYSIDPHFGIVIPERRRGWGGRE